MNLVYLTVGFSPVVEAQVFNLLRYFSNEKYFDKIYLLIGVSNQKDINKVVIENLKQAGIIVLLCKQLPILPLFFTLQSRIFRKHFREICTENTIIHIRGESQAISVAKAIRGFKINIPLIIDVRGSVIEEIEYQSYSKLLKIAKKLTYRLIHKHLGQNQYNYSFVSNGLMNYFNIIVTNSNHSNIINHSIAGNQFQFNADERKRIRHKLGLNDDDVLVVFSSGENSNWQNTQLIISKFEDIAGKLSDRISIKILNLSKVIIDSPLVINLYLKINDVPSYLSAADIGLIFRNQDVVNNVASPVKFSEYVCCGLPIISNRSVQLINEYIENTGFGLIKDSFDDIKDIDIMNLININRTEISNFGKNIFHVSSIAKSYKMFYEEIIKS